VAAPVFEADGVVVASIAQSVPLQRGTRQRMRSLVPFVVGRPRRLLTGLASIGGSCSAATVPSAVAHRLA